MGLVIRKPTPDDAPGLAKAACDLGAQYANSEPDRFQVPDQSSLIDWLSKSLAEPVQQDELWLVADLDGAAVGDAQAQFHAPVATAAIQRGLDSGRCRVYLNYLAVQADYRSHGIGTALISRVEAWARSKGAELLLTDTNLRSNFGAVEFYERQGFQKQAVILHKRLD